jgi:hypothetical protein
VKINTEKSVASSLVRRVAGARTTRDAHGIIAKAHDDIMGLAVEERAVLYAKLVAILKELPMRK